MMKRTALAISQETEPSFSPWFVEMYQLISLNKIKH
jgi:hypothetical protein